MKNIIIYICLSLILAFIIKYSIEINIIYPKWVIIFISEPFYRFILYFTIFFISFYYPIIAFYLLIAILFVHLDQINLFQNKKLYNK
jgi:hypothetical protein